MENVYKKNMKVLEKHSPFMADFFNKNEGVEEQFEKKCVQAKDGTDILYIEKNGEIYRMNSAYAPKKEAQIWADSFPVRNLEDICVVYGFGTGIFIREALNKLQEGNLLLVYEPSRELFEYVLKSFDISDLLENKKLCLLVNGVNEQQLYQVLEYSMNSSEMSIDNIVSLPYYKEIFEQEYIEFTEQYVKHQKNAKVMQNTILELSSSSYDNMIKNINYFLISKSFEDLKRRMPKNITAIMVSAGPSLRENLQFLRKAKGKAVIVAVERVLDLLLDQGIEPDFIATIDPIKPVTDKMKKQDIKIPLFTIPEANHVLLENHMGDKIFTNAGKMYECFLKHTETENIAVEMDASVATYVFGVLIEMGMKRIVMVGQDLAFGKKGAYVDNNNFHASENPFGEYIKAEGVNGETVYTRQDWKRFSDFFEKTIQEHPEIDVIDVKSEGLKIRGTKQMEADDVLEYYCNCEIPIKEWTSQIKNLFSEEEQKLSKIELEKMIEQIKEGMLIAEKIIEQCEKNTDVKKIMDMNKILEEKKVMKDLNDVILYRTWKQQKRIAVVSEEEELVSIIKEMYSIIFQLLEEQKQKMKQILEMEIWN